MKPPFWSVLNKCLLYCKCFGTNGPKATELLSHRTLLKIKGKDAESLLQSLMTNDITPLVESKAGSLYTMFLNPKGRVLYDTLIYKVPESNFYLLEVDQVASKSLQQHLKMYCVRKDAKVESSDYSVFVNFNHQMLNLDPKIELDQVYNNMTHKGPGSDSVIVYETDGFQLMEFFDPRTPLLGSRIIAHSKATEKVYKTYGKETKGLYKMFRYRLGIPEGTEDLPVSKCLPLEANCDYLNGVSFDKGCYLGQELTARSYHTGVIRKRYMPLFFNEDCREEVITDDTVKVGDKKVGVLRGKIKNYGIGLLRLAEVENKTLSIGGMTAFTSRPIWFPCESLPIQKIAQ